MKIDPKLIFDIGAHLGLDTAYYLELGYRVVAVEPVAEYCQRISKASYGKYPTCHVLNAAITRDGKPATLYLSEHRLGETHSIYPARVRGGSYATVTVPGLTITEIIENLDAVPHYMKVDIEGSDLIPLRQLAPTSFRPPYISIELDHRHEEDALEAFLLAYSMGYTETQLVNQARVREGEYGERFKGGGMSGPFGELLPSAGWKDINQCAIEWFTKEEAIAEGQWYDLHLRHMGTNSAKEQFFMAYDRILTKAEKDAMEKLSIGILDLCDASGMKDGELIANAAIIGCAGVIASTIPDEAPFSVVQVMATRAGNALADEIVKGQRRFIEDMAAVATKPN